MLDNAITWSVDVANDGNPSPQIFTRLHEYDDKTVYYGPNHTRAMRELLTITRTEGKPSGTFRGLDVSNVKQTIDVIVDGSDGVERVAPFTATFEFRMPVGIDPAIVKAVRQRFVSMLDDDNTMDRIHLILEV